jgi:hypothetical protein
MKIYKLVLLGLMLSLSGSLAFAQLGYTLDVTTFYQFGNPAGTLGPYGASPDTGFFTITNNGTTTFTGTIGEVAMSSGGADFSYTIPGLTLAPGQSDTFVTSPESSNVGGFNGPFGSPQPGIQITLNGLINGSEGVNLSVNDSNIHSGVPRTNPFGVTLDNYILQGGDPSGNDTGDGYETSQSPGHFRFFEASGAAVPEPSSLLLLGAVVGIIGTKLLRNRA